jgi:hypothetical protein
MVCRLIGALAVSARSYTWPFPSPKKTPSFPFTVVTYFFVIQRLDFFGCLRFIATDQAGDDQLFLHVETTTPAMDNLHLFPPSGFFSHRERAGRLLKEIVLCVLPGWEHQTVGDGTRLRSDVERARGTTSNSDLCAVAPGDRVTHRQLIFIGGGALQGHGDLYNFWEKQRG